jgi:hypothetical protein
LNTAEIITVDPQDWPRCHVCDMAVELFESVLTPTDLLLVARCHGAIEQVTIPHNTWDSFDPAGFSLTDAFVEPTQLNITEALEMK